MTSSNPAVFNNPKHSDVVLQFGDHRIHAHKVVLRMWSPFFERTFNSKFPVAESNTFIIDSEDDADYEPLLAILMHIYGMPLCRHPHNDPSVDLFYPGLLDFWLKVYVLADKYDVPSVRVAVITLLGIKFKVDELDALRYHAFRIEIPHLPDFIAQICGPDAPQLADTCMRNHMFEWLFNNFILVSEDKDFIMKLEDGSLLDTELTARLLLRLAGRMKRLRAKKV